MRIGPAGRTGIARSARLFALAIPLVLAAAAGCSCPTGRHAPGEPLADKRWLNRDSVADYRNADADSVAGLAAAMQNEPPAPAADHPLNVLCVSGGGKYAAFTVGVLCGWTLTGTRPTFDVATGVSSGAPVALMAFLGPKYDGLASDLFINMKRGDLYRWRPVRGLIHGTGLMTSRPLEHVLETHITEEAMDELRAAHAAGRRLFVATANVITHKLTIWDVGAIASSGRPDAIVIVRKVFLAACSIPGLVPPVKFDVTVNGVHYCEYHGDAGNITQVFVRTVGPMPPGSTVWILSAGKTHVNCSHGHPRVLESMATAVSAGLYSLFRADTMKVFALCGVTHSRFRMMALPQNFDGHTSSMVFDPKESRRMYRLGYQMAVAGAWETQPPDTAPDDICPPRAGLDFVTPK
jgi:hypothetical protein